MPKALNYDAESNDESMALNESTPSSFVDERSTILRLRVKDITIGKLICCKDSLFAILAGCIAMYNVSFFSSFLAIKIETYGVSAEDMGYAFMCLSFPYFFAAILIPMCFSKVPPKI